MIRMHAAAFITACSAWLIATIASAQDMNVPPISPEPLGTGLDPMTGGLGPMLALFGLGILVAILAAFVVAATNAVRERRWRRGA